MTELEYPAAEKPQNISFVTNANPGVASFRYRIQVPAVVLSKRGHKVTVDAKVDPESTTVVFSKHWSCSDIAYSQFCRLRGQYVIYDICDSHYGDELEWYYREMVEQANLITVNSIEMRKIMQKHTKKKVVVIDDPVTQPPQPFKEDFPPRMAWYGNPQNLPGLFSAYTKDIKVPLELAVSGRVEVPEHFQQEHISYCQWHPDVIAELATRNSIALLPYRQGKLAKSANRVIEAIQSGMFVIADIIPATVPIPGVWDLKRGLEEGIKHYLSGKAKEDVEAGQEFIQRYYPLEIAKKWEKVFK